MSTSNTLRTLAAMITVSIVLVACEPAPKAHNHVVLLDISGSSLKDLDDRASDIEHKLLRTMGPKDRISVLAIDDASESWAKPLFQLDLGAKNFVNRSLPVTVRRTVADQDRAAYLDSVISGFSSALHAAVARRTDSKNLTDIIGAFANAKTEIQPGMVNHLVVLSDMLNEGRDLNFQTMLNQGLDLQSALDNCPKTELPFDDVCVFTGDNATLGAPKFRALKGFWESWFAQQHVPLRIYTSGGIRTDLAQNQ